MCGARCWAASVCGAGVLLRCALAERAFVVIRSSCVFVFVKISSFCHRGSVTPVQLRYTVMPMWLAEYWRFVRTCLSHRRHMAVAAGGLQIIATNIILKLSVIAVYIFFSTALVLLCIRDAMLRWKFGLIAKTICFDLRVETLNSPRNSAYNISRTVIFSYIAR